MIYKATFVDNGLLLTEQSIPYLKIGSYLIIGEFQQYPTWLLLVTVIKSEISKIIPLIKLLHPDCSFAIPENSDVHGKLLAGNSGNALAGQIVTIQIQHLNKHEQISKIVIDFMKDLKGVKIYAGYKLGTNVYAQYGVPSFCETVHSDDQQIETDWPFGKLIKNAPRKPSRWLKQKYYLSNRLKADSKGSVYKALRINGLFDINWCIVKEGKVNQCTDDYGRTIKDRLKWQLHIQDILSGSGYLPKVIEYFEFDEDSYLVMEYINGVPFHDKLSQIQEGVIYYRLDINRKEELIRLIKQLIRIIEVFHEIGLVHRDITPVNFIVNEANRLVAIDVELSYDLKNLQPSPWFTLGTNGYMSEQQRKLAAPTIQDDLYGLCGTIIRALTGISAIKFERLESDELLFKHLNFFLKDQRLASILASGRAKHPESRPQIMSIRHALDVHHALIITERKSEAEPFAEIDENLLRRVIKGGLSHLSMQSAGLKSQADQSFPDNNLYHLISALHIQTKGSIVGLDYIQTNEAQDRMLSELFQNVSNNIDLLTFPGLIDGNLGMAIVLAEMIADGQLERSINHMNVIYSLLASKDADLNLTDGLAGVAVAKLRVAELLRFPVLSADIEEIIESFKKSQNRKGYWADTGEKYSRVSNGLFNGTAGIAYLMLAYGMLNDDVAKASAIRAFDWLASQFVATGGWNYIPPNSKDKKPDPWLENGFTGIAFAFIKAYEFTGNIKYKEVAVKLLLNHPYFMTSNFIGQGNGISGVGEVYLEAYRVFSEDEWLLRARHIGNFLCHTYCQSAENTIYWVDGNEVHSNIGFWDGNSGILHFLCRLAKPEMIDFPFIDLKI